MQGYVMFSKYHVTFAGEITLLGLFVCFLAGFLKGQMWMRIQPRLEFKF